MIIPRSEQGWGHSQRAANVCHPGTPCFTHKTSFVSFSREPVSMNKMPTSAIFQHIQPLQVAPGIDRRLRTWSAPAHCFLHDQLEQGQHDRPDSWLTRTGDAIQTGYPSSMDQQCCPDGSTGVQAPGWCVARMQGAPWEHGSLHISMPGPHSLAASQQELPPVPTRPGKRTVGAGSTTFASADRRDSMNRSQARSLPTTRLLSCERTDMAFPSPGW
jgi:hypothetical protein